MNNKETKEQRKSFTGAKGEKKQTTKGLFDPPLTFG